MAKGHRLTPDNLETMRKMFLDGHDAEEIARRLKVSSSTIEKRLRNRPRVARPDLPPNGRPSALGDPIVAYAVGQLESAVKLLRSVLGPKGS